jgi:hypothetical protein
LGLVVAQRAFVPSMIPAILEDSKANLLPVPII